MVNSESTAETSKSGGSLHDLYDLNDKSDGTPHMSMPHCLVPSLQLTFI